MSVAIKRSFAPPRDVEWAFVITPLVKRWISSTLPEAGSLAETGATPAPRRFSSRTVAPKEMAPSNRLTSPACSDITEAFDARLATFKRELAKAKEIKQLDRRIKRVAAVRAEIKALVEAYHAALA